eukprot:scpid96355/ scgid24516/ 
MPLTLLYSTMAKVKCNQSYQQLQWFNRCGQRCLCCQWKVAARMAFCSFKEMLFLTPQLCVDLTIGVPSLLTAPHCLTINWIFSIIISWHARIAGVLEVEQQMLLLDVCMLRIQ